MTNYVEDHYRTLLSEYGGDPEQADFYVLSQGGGVHTIHEAIVRYTPGLEGTVLDLGCGTALILDEMDKQGRMAAFYTGVDMLEERRQPVLDRLGKYKLWGEYFNKPAEQSFRDVPFTVGVRYDVALNIGVIGFWGAHEHRHILDQVDFMKGIARHGCVSFQMIYDEMTSMGGQHHRRWDPTDIKDLLKVPDDCLIVLDSCHCFLVVW